MTLQMVLIVSIGVAQAAALVFLLILYRRVHEAIQARWNAKRRDELRPLFNRYICGDVSIEQLQRAVGSATAVAQELALYFLGELAEGEARVRLLKAVDDLGMLGRALRNLRSLDWAKRDIAAMHLGIYGLKETVADLVILLRDRRVEVRYTAARSLGLIGSTEAVQAVIGLMDYPELLDTPRVLEIVHSMGAQASEPLMRLLERNGHRPEVKLLALDLVGDLREYSMISELHRTLRSLNTEETLRAVRAIGKFSAPQTTGDIVRLIGDRSWQVRAQAVKAVGQLQIDAAIPQLVEALRDQSYWVRFNAAIALVALGDPGVRALAGERWTRDKFARDVAQYQIERLNGKLELLGLTQFTETQTSDEPAPEPVASKRIPSMETC